MPHTSSHVEAQEIVVHEDALDASCQSASRSVDQLIWHGNAEVAKAVTVFGPGIVVLPMLGKVSGVDEQRCLAYAAHPKRAARSGLMDRIDFESKFGHFEPGRLMEELAGGRASLDRHMQALSNEELHDEVVALQDWREKASGRLKTLEKRAAWAFLGMPVGFASQASIKKAFKRKALELHPDKGGDVERFQLLQEMKALLILPTPKEMEEQEKQQRERAEDIEKSNSKERDREKNRKEKEEEDVAEGSGFSSDSSYDVDDEFKKMFPKKKKRTRNGEDDQADGDFNLGIGEHFDRARHETARRKLHRVFVDMWDRAGKLADEIRRTPTSCGGEALRQLRKFVNRFSSLEMSKLKENDPKKADRIFRKFLEQGAEVLCVAGAVDPVATVSTVTMQVNYPLQATAPSAELAQKCNALIEAIKSLPSMSARFISPVEDAVAERKRVMREVARGVGANTQEVPRRFKFLVPVPTSRPAGEELPGFSEVEIELPAGSHLADLRAAALQVNGGNVFCKVPPRLFCGGQFIGGSDDTPLACIRALEQGWPVQCLPSNRVLRPKIPPRHARVPYSTLPNDVPACPAMTEATAGAVTQGLKLGEFLTGKITGMEATSQAANIKNNRTMERQSAADRKVKEECLGAEPKAAKEDDEEQGDAWFDNFFAGTKNVTNSKMQREREVENTHYFVERTRKEAEEGSQDVERLQRNTAQEQGRLAMEARLRAQNQAAEAKRKLEQDRKKALEAKRAAEQQRAEHLGREKVAEAAVQRLEHGACKVQATSENFAIILATADSGKTSLQVRRTRWDDNWVHPCAGEKRSDGLAVYCHPCDSWINIGDPYDHHGFELHCEKVGHYGWID